MNRATTLLIVKATTRGLCFSRHFNQKLTINTHPRLIAGDIRKDKGSGRRLAVPRKRRAQSIS